MNNGAAIVYINMQEPCSKDLPPLCSAALAMATTDEPKTAHLSDESVLVAKAESNHDLRKRNRHGHRYRRRGHHATKKHRRGHLKHRHNQHCHDKNKHPYKDFCVTVGDFCGNNLYDCDFVATTQYRCDAIGEHPKPITEDSASCGGTKACLCPASPIGLICGSSFPEECKLPKDTLYECSGHGATPTEKVKCAKDMCIPTVGDHKCERDPCSCKDDIATCGSVFPRECELDPHTVYNCAGADSDPTVGEVCMTKCIEKEGPDECSPESKPDSKECQCQDNYDICGSLFPFYCKRDFDTLYKCSGNGTRPSDPKPCTPGLCIVHEGNDECRNLCVCREAKESVCGKNFDMSCLLDDGTLYECAFPGATPKPIEKCKAGCEEGGGDSGDVCKDPCVCPTRGEMRVCGSKLPTECKADKNAVYLCPGGERSKPSFIGHCMPGVECIHERALDDAYCGTHNCDCVGSNEVCSDFFPVKCGSEPNTVYKCTANGKHEKVGFCNAGEVCITVSDGSICRIDDCKCLSDGLTCGESFPASCNIPTEAL